MKVKLDDQALDNIRVQVITNVKETLGIVITEFTCDDCEHRYLCDCVFDAYNTDGDCLASK